MILTPKVVIGVHPINITAHPTYPPGFRWCVMIGDGAWDDLDRCVQAGHQYDRVTAALVGDTVGVAVAEAFRRFAMPLQYGGVIHLEHDPIPAAHDFLPLVDYRDPGGL